MAPTLTGSSFVLVDAFLSFGLFGIAVGLWLTGFV